jgi:hypothetical protein
MCNPDCVDNLPSSVSLERPVPAHRWIIEPDLCRIETLCFKRATNPALQLFVLLMRRIGQRLEQGLVAPGTATVFRRTRALAGRACHGSF